MPVDPRPPIGGQFISTRYAAAPGGPPAAAGFDAALADATVGQPGAEAAADPVDLRGLDGRERTRQFVQRQPSRAAAGDQSWLFGEDGFGFDDLIDVVNPLQHIPIVSTIYRWITGDEISPAANMAGGALFGGPLGLAGAVASEVIDAATGRDLGEHAMAMAFGEEGEAGGSPDAGSIASVATEPAAAETARSAAAPMASQLAAADAGPRFIQLERVRDAGSAPQLVPVVAPASVQAMPPTAAGRESDQVESPETETVEAVMAEEMMQALEKYEALMRSRAAAQPPAGPAAGSLYDGHI